MSSGLELDTAPRAKISGQSGDEFERGVLGSTGTRERRSSYYVSLLVNVQMVVTCGFLNPDLTIPTSSGTDWERVFKSSYCW